MIKIINPCKCEEKNAFVKIKYVEGKLSLSGVIGPKRNGDCSGSCGQCIDEIRSGEPTENWSRKNLAKLCNIWERWHLNDMNPCCEHQRKLGWMEEAEEKVTLYHYRLKPDILKKQKEAERVALTALKNGKIFCPTEEQVRLANLSYSLVSWEENPPDDYEPKRELNPGDIGATETKTLGWLTPEEHSEGLLGKPCPICGYKYGTSRVREEVPQDVVDWLFNLPETEITPAWI